MGLLAIGTVTAQDGGPSAGRMFDTSSVPAEGGPVVVTITVTGATQGVVIEELPGGFSYDSSSLDDSQVRINGQEISFILADSDDNPFTYTVRVSQTGSISGKLVADRVDYRVTGDSNVTVRQAAGPSAGRMFDTSSVPAEGGPVVVTITVTGATQGVVIEELPGGFSYDSSSLDDSQVRINGQEISFILADSDDNPFTYTVRVSQTGSISGKLVADRVDYRVTGDSNVTVRQAAGPSAGRMFDTSSVPAEGGPVVVTITVTGATQGVVIEELPGGFSYDSSSLDDSQVRINGQEISFILADSDDNPFTYTVRVSQTGSISGKLVADRVDYRVTGDSRVTVRVAAPEPEPAPAPAPAPQGNRAPAFPGSSTTRSIDENSASGANVGARVRATDADGDRLTYSLRGTDAGSFTINSRGQIMVGTGTMLDFEDKASYIVTVRATDGSASDTISVTVTVGNVDEDGMVTIMPSTTPQVGTELTASLEDPDGSVANLMWQWQKDDGQGNYVDIPGATMMSYTPVMADDDSRLQAAADYDDAEGTGKTAMMATSAKVGETPSTGNANADRYDTNPQDGMINGEEALDAVVDYFDRKITSEQVLDVLVVYFG